MSIINNRYDFVMFFDVKDGNPNGDPDAGNLPRVDPEDGRGLVTDVCLKRKVRNYVAITKENKPPYEIYVQEKAILNNQHERAYEALELDPKVGKKGDKQENSEKARQWMCANFFDIRTFGAVMTTGDATAGQVLGPVQMTFARSIDRIIPAEHSITRMAVTTQREADQQAGDNRTMGRKATIPYALYRAHGFINVPPAQKTGFRKEDLTLFWEALCNMFDLDRSAARGMMASRALIAFKHESPLGNAPAAKLFDRVRVRRLNAETPPRDYILDYKVEVDDSDLPAGVTLLQVL